MFRFDKKVVLVTGSGGGIGRGTALYFAKLGADLAIIDVDEEKARGTAKEVDALGQKALAIQADVSIVEDCVRMIEMTMQKFGHLDVLFASAGIGGGNIHLKDLPVEDWDRLLAINLRGMFLTCKYGMPALIKSGGGAIVLMSSSTAGWDVIYGGAAYMASKEAAKGLTRNLALEAAPYGIRVNAVCPGIIDTQLSFGQSGAGEDAQQGWLERFRQRIPLRRVGQPEDVASAVAYLASDEARHITGATLLIDGGQTLQSWSNAPGEEAYPFFS